LRLEEINDIFPFFAYFFEFLHLIPHLNELAIEDLVFFGFYRLILHYFSQFAELFAGFLKGFLLVFNDLLQVVYGFFKSLFFSC
jgi:hypothetical protein